MPAPYKIADGRADDGGGAEEAVERAVAEAGGEEPQGRGGDADADVERPEVGRGRKTRALGRHARDGERLEGGTDGAEARAEDGGGEEEGGGALGGGEAKKAAEEEDEPRIDRVVGALLVEEAADEGARRHDDEGEDGEEGADAFVHAERARVERDEGQDAAVGEEDDAAEKRHGHGALFYEGKAARLVLRGQDDGVGEPLAVREPKREEGARREEGEHGERAAGADEEQADEGADDHREVRREREVADARALLRRGQHERRQRRRRRRAEREFDAVHEAQRVEHFLRMREAEGEHDGEEGERRAEEQPALVDAVDEPARKGAAGDGANLEEGHGKPRFELAALHVVHDVDGQPHDEDVLRHEVEEVRTAEADEFGCPELLAVLFLHVVQCLAFFFISSSTRVCRARRGCLRCRRSAP